MNLAISNTARRCLGVLIRVQALFNQILHPIQELMFQDFVAIAMKLRIFWRHSRENGNPLITLP
jgi:hypothetical protein